MKPGFRVGVELGSGSGPRNNQENNCSAITFKGYTVQASKEKPQYLIKSDKTDHLTIHKGSASTKISKRNRASRNGECAG